jgi:crotonobetainyl-CoA:carnitine CoA-transferase CaiB-like acyl-CoA transferase
MPSRLSAWAIYDVFNARDDEQVFMGVVSDSQWLSFCQAFGFEQLGSDPELARNTQRVHARSRILPLVRERLATLPKQLPQCGQDRDGAEHPAHHVIHRSTSA